MLSVSYVGSQNRHQNDYRETNLPDQSLLPSIAAGTAGSYNTLVPYLGFHSIKQSETVQNGHYNSLQTEFRSQMTRDLSLQAAYTFSKAYDPATGVNHELATLRNEQGTEVERDLWTTCFTGRELELLAAGAGLAVDRVAGVAPGKYGADTPTLSHPELLLIARRPHFPDPGPTL